jgi:hypothetical protein
MQWMSQHLEHVDGGLRLAFALNESHYGTPYEFALSGGKGDRVGDHRGSPARSQATSSIANEIDSASVIRPRRTTSS